MLFFVGWTCKTKRGERENEEEEENEARLPLHQNSTVEKEKEKKTRKRKGLLFLFSVFPLIFFSSLYLFRHARAPLAAGRDEAGTAAMDQEQRGLFHRRSVDIIIFIADLEQSPTTVFLPFRPSRRPRRDPEAADLQPRRDRLSNHPHGAQAR